MPDDRLQQAEELAKAAMVALWSMGGQPDVIMVGKRNHVSYRRELAASNAATQFEGADWRRIKREMNKARKEIS